MNPLRALRRFLRPGLLVLAGVLPAASPASAAEPVVRAQLVSRQVAVLASEIGARILRLHAPEGGAFRAGDPLISFDDALQRAQVARADAVLAAAEKTYAANQRLFRLSSIGQIELDLSAAEVAKARAELTYASAMLAKCRIAAPFSGRVSEQRVHEQEFVQPGQPLLEIIDDAQPEIDFIAPSKWLVSLRPGQPLEVRVDETGGVYPATVERIGAKVDPVSQSVKVVAALAGDFPELITGMSGTILLPAQKHP